MSHPHGWVFGKREFGRLRTVLRTEDKKIHAAPAQFVARTANFWPVHIRRRRPASRCCWPTANTVTR